MVKYDDPNQTKIVKFTLPFSGQLDPNNRWIQLADMIPWRELYGKYTKRMRKDSCQPSRWSGAGWLDVWLLNLGLQLAH